nr:unnamed protein product [Callosobruchus chinensis]
MYRLKKTINIVTIGDNRNKKKNPKRLKTSDRNKLQPKLILPFWRQRRGHMSCANLTVLFKRNKDNQKLY